MCVEWPKSKDACGYGRAWFDGKPIGAHRLAYCQAHGLKPADLARRFGVKVGTVQQIIKGTAYREVM